MDLLKWAEKEIEIACKREAPDREDGMWDYGCACYESAMKAFKSLLEDGHSGFSISMTKHILNRLIDGKPLTPIEDTDDIWNLCTKYGDDNYTQYQCIRMSSLFKEVYDDGRIEYKDVDRVSVVDINNPSGTWHNGFISKMIREMFPITMPYMPEPKPYMVYSEDFLTDKRNGDYDTIGVYYVVKPDGEKAYINRYFKETETGFVEIDHREYAERKGMRIER